MRRAAAGHATGTVTTFCRDAPRRHAGAVPRDAVRDDAAEAARVRVERTLDR